jgi:hypothetical protein
VSDDLEFSMSVLQRVARSLTPGFTGLGVIFYRSPALLPVVPLGNPSRLPYELPIAGFERIAATLAELADARCPFHDGFHLLDLGSQALTHVAQYVSPPLPTGDELQSASWPSGARQMTALLASRIGAVSTVGLLSSVEATVFAKGHLVRSSRTQQA